MTEAQFVESLEGPKKHGLSTKLMITQCAWCGCTINHRWTYTGGVSHGICPECKKKVMREHKAALV
jgi:hypothetical protein